MEIWKVWVRLGLVVEEGWSDVWVGEILLFGEIVEYVWRMIEDVRDGVDIDVFV